MCDARSFRAALLAVALLALAVAAPSRARAGDIVDTRLTFCFGDDDVLKGAGESTPSSPAAGFLCGPQNTQFFDNYETKTSGFDNFANIVVYKKFETYWTRLSVDAALALRLSQSVLLGTSGIPFRDESSYIRLTYRPGSWADAESLQFIAFPISADRFRLGYSYRLSWGGSAIMPQGRAQTFPGFKVQVRKGPVLAYVGAKSAQNLNARIQEEETNYSLLTGVSVDLGPSIRVEANGGYIQRGTNPAQAVLGADFDTFGGSTQVSYSKGEPVGTSIDFALYRNDPSNPQRFFRTENYPGGLSYVAAAEATVVATSLADPAPTKSGSTILQQGYAGDLQLRVKYDYLRVHLTSMIRNLAYLTLNQGSVTPNVALPEGLEQTPEFFVAAGADYHLPALHLTPGITFGFQQPAAFTSAKLSDIIGNNPVAANIGRRTVVVREDPSFANRILQDILPNNCGADLTEACEAKPILGAKVSTRLDLGENVSATGEVYTNFNSNRVRFVDNEFGVAQRRYDDPLQLGFNLFLSARY